MADEIRTVTLDEIMEYSVDFVIVIGYHNGEEVKICETKKFTCKSLEEARRKAIDRSMDITNTYTASVEIKIPVEKKKLFSKDTKTVGKWMMLEKYEYGKLKRSKKIELIEEEKPAVDLWADLGRI